MKTKTLIILLILAAMMVPHIILAADPPTTVLVPCNNSAANPCDFNALMKMINIIINFILFKLALPIAAIMFAYAGILMVTAGGGEGKTKAKHIFINTVLGVLLAAGAWLIISTILFVLGYDGSWIGLKIGL